MPPTMIISRRIDLFYSLPADGGERIRIINVSSRYTVKTHGLLTGNTPRIACQQLCIFQLFSGMCLVKAITTA